MKNKRQKYMWLSLLLAGIICISSGVAVWADDESDSEVLSQESDAETLDDTEWMNKLASEQIEMEMQENTEENDQIDAEKKEDMTFDQNGDMSTTVSENEIENEQTVISGNTLSSDNMDQEKLSMVTDVQSVSEEMQNETFSIVLPVEIPFDITLLNKEGLRGVASSQQFCIENRGDKDVRISLQGFCRGLNDREYVMGNDFAENGVVQGKKNVWMYMRWEDEEHRVLDEPVIVMGDTSPGTGEILLKAPEKNEDGIISESKVYFSFCGALESDTGDSWKDNELTLELIFSMETVNSENSVQNDGTLLNDSDMTENPPAMSFPESVSDNVSEAGANNGKDRLDYEESIQSAQISGDNTNMVHDEEALQKSFDIEN